MSLNMRGVVQLVLCTLFLGLAAACQSSAPVTPQNTAQSDSVSQTDAGDYRLGPADRLRVTVFGHDDLTNEYTVASNGTVSFPLIGDLDAGEGCVGGGEGTSSGWDGYRRKELFCASLPSHHSSIPSLSWPERRRWY